VISADGTTLSGTAEAGATVLWTPTETERM
jgi:hypothetical protein